MLNIRPLQESDLIGVLKFTDQEIGSGYYTLDELRDIYQRSISTADQIMCSFALVDVDEQAAEGAQEAIKGIRFSFPAGQWNKGKGIGLSPKLWPYPISQTAYFQSLFLAPEVQGKAWGGRLSEMSLQALRKSGASGVVCHSWKESPNNSSVKYLKKVGFKEVAEYPRYWQNVKYDCPICKKPPCQCTAIEMYLDLKEDK